MTKWGLSATIKAPAKDILAFAAYHLSLGAHRLYLYLDAPNPEAFDRLKAHPKIRVTLCDDNHWNRLNIRRPDKHQARQTANATHAYARRIEVDWLIHLDVDEFLWPDAPMDQILKSLPSDTFCARIRPIEALAGDGTAFKGFIPGNADRDEIVRRVYPRFGQYVRGGFLSHLAGKLFVRTGPGTLTVKIHNVFRNDEMNPQQIELQNIALCHVHATSWDQWIAAYRFRLEKGSYRAELGPNKPKDQGGQTLHQVLSMIEMTQGSNGLRAFFDELCADTPELRKRLHHEGLLHMCDLQLDHERQKHFPD